MAKKWEDIRDRYLAEPGAAEKVAAIMQAMEDAIALSDMRELRQMTQAELAEKLGTTQPRVSVLERQRDLYLSTLAEYVEALGGELILIADFGDDKVRITVHEDELVTAD